MYRKTFAEKPQYLRFATALPTQETIRAALPPKIGRRTSAFPKKVSIFG